MRTCEHLAFMLVDRKDLGRACVAATTFRRQHSAWHLRLFVRGALPAPWNDFSAACFDQRISMNDLPTIFNVKNCSSEFSDFRNLESVFAYLFKEGVLSATYINHDHVWFGHLHSLESCESSLAIRAVRTVAQRHENRKNLVSLSMHRDDDIASITRLNALSDHVVSQKLHFSDMPSPMLDSLLGLTLDDLQREQLRFDCEGHLRLGKLAVLSACLGDRHYDISPQTAIDTTWIELEKWYFSELKRFS